MSDAGQLHTSHQSYPVTKIQVSETQFEAAILRLKSCLVLLELIKLPFQSDCVPAEIDLCPNMMYCLVFYFQDETICPLCGSTYLKKVYN